MMRNSLLIFFLAAKVAVCSHAADLSHLAGQVVRVVDGDTIVLKVADAQHRVHLAGIDAPEKNQAWGESSTHELRRQIAGRHVVFGWRKRDRSERLIGVVRLAGRDMNLHMIDLGLAWHYEQYADEQSPGDSEAYSAAEKAARDARRGLWSEPEPIPPWEWRSR